MAFSVCVEDARVSQVERPILERDQAAHASWRDRHGRDGDPRLIAQPRPAELETSVGLSLDDVPPHASVAEYERAPCPGGKRAFDSLGKPLAQCFRGRPGAVDAIRLGVEPSRVLAIGDRLETDIEGAHHAGMDSLLVLTGVHGVEDALAAPPEERPTWVARDLRALLDDLESLEPARDALREEWAARDEVSDGDHDRELPTVLSDLTGEETAPQGH